MQHMKSLQKHLCVDINIYAWINFLVCSSEFPNNILLQNSDSKTKTHSSENKQTVYFTSKQEFLSLANTGHFLTSRKNVLKRKSAQHLLTTIYVLRSGSKADSKFCLNVIVALREKYCLQLKAAI